MMAWIVATIDRYCLGEEQGVTVYAEIRGAWAVHPTLTAGLLSPDDIRTDAGWTITHIPTGYRVGHDGRPYSAAIRTLRCLRRRCPNVYATGYPIGGDDEARAILCDGADA